MTDNMIEVMNIAFDSTAESFLDWFWSEIARVQSPNFLHSDVTKVIKLDYEVIQPNTIGRYDQHYKHTTIIFDCSIIDELNNNGDSNNTPYEGTVCWMEIKKITENKIQVSWENWTDLGLDFMKFLFNTVRETVNVFQPYAGFYCLSYKKGFIKTNIESLIGNFSLENHGVKLPKGKVLVRWKQIWKHTKIMREKGAIYSEITKYLLKSHKDISYEERNLRNVYRAGDLGLLD